MGQVAVRILHLDAGPGAGPLTALLAEARRVNAERLAAGFRGAGASDVQVISGPEDGKPFGTRLRQLAGDLEAGSGLIVLGSGSIPLAHPTDLAALVEVAGSGEHRALANNRYSADVIALGRSDVLARVPDLAADNALPRWLAEVGGYTVDDLRRRLRLGMDLDSPLDLLLIGRTQPGAEFEAIAARLAALRDVAADRREELLVAGRTSAAVLRWLERSTACRVRAWVEERGLRASSSESLVTRRSPQRPPRSVLGLVLDDRGPDALGDIVASLADGAFIDSRVLLAHRHGPDESAWPGPEDRFASDLLLADAVRDPWLRSLTSSARDAAIPIVLGGHSLVGPGLRLALRGRQ